MIIKIGMTELFLEKEPVVVINEESGFMRIIFKVYDEEGEMYELHYLSSLDDPDLIIKKEK